MVLELVTLRVRKEERPAFEQAIEKALRLLPGIAGYLSHELRRSLDEEGVYLLLREWRALESVTLGFRKSREFVRWHELLASLVEAAPQVSYFDRDIAHAASDAQGEPAID